MSNPNLGAPQPATNYLVPSSGGTHFVPVSGVFGGTAFVVDFRQFTVDQFPFNPQGVFIDNSQGTGDLQVAISPGGWVIDCPAGARMSTSYPAPNGQSCSITGNGQATVIFVDFPVLPNAGAVSVIGTVNVNVTGPNPLPVLPPVNVGGVPYQVNVEPLTAQVIDGFVTTTAAPMNVAAPANTFLRKLILSIGGNATLAAAGGNGFTITLNGVQLVHYDVEVPAAVSNGVLFAVVLDFDTAAPAAGAAGFLQASIGTNFTAGGLWVWAFFA